MRSAFLVVAFLIGSFGAAHADPGAGRAQDPLAGSHVFGSKGCVKCHAVNGIGGKVGPDLARIPRPRSVADLAVAMWNHLPRMASTMQQMGIPSPQLDARSAGDLVAFLFTLDYFDPPGSRDVGRMLFQERRCVTCHQVEGTGGIVGPNLDFFKQQGTPISLAAALWNHGPGMSEAMRTRGIRRPMFKERELADIIAYLQSASPASSIEQLYVLPGRAEDGRRLFGAKGCATCHGLDGRAGRVGPDLVERQSARTLTQFAAAMWNKSPSMLRAMSAQGIAVPQLRPDEMADIVAFLYSVRYFAEAGDATRGALVASERGCVSCHQPETSSGLERTRGLDTPGAVIAALWNHASLAAESRGSWPKLRPREMADLVAWLEARVAASR